MCASRPTRQKVSNEAQGDASHQKHLFVVENCASTFPSLSMCLDPRLPNSSLFVSFMAATHCKCNRASQVARRTLAERPAWKSERYHGTVPFFVRFAWCAEFIVVIMKRRFLQLTTTSLRLITRTYAPSVGAWKAISNSSVFRCQQRLPSELDEEIKVAFKPSSTEDRVRRPPASVVVGSSPCRGFNYTRLKWPIKMVSMQCWCFPRNWWQLATWSVSVGFASHSSRLLFYTMMDDTRMEKYNFCWILWRSFACPSPWCSASVECGWKWKSGFALNWSIWKRPTLARWQGWVFLVPAMTLLHGLWSDPNSFLLHWVLGR